MKHKIRIAIYMRVSQEDGDDESESSSIANQRHLLRTYVERRFDSFDLLEYQDDGYTGANFDRPGVLELLEQVRKGRIDCIVVKDLSRFSRDYIETGTYLERIFPFAGVRFIAVNDGYDSNHYSGDAAGIDVSFKNLMNDFYCKDISLKVKSALAIKKEKGIYSNGSCTFGYRKDSKDRHILLIDEEEAAVVRRIFRMTMDGISSHKIAQIFNSEGVKTPIEFKMERGIAAMKPKGRSFAWSGATICRMLRNATYAGDLVYNKYETPEVSGKPRLKPRSEWKVFKNHHEAIIDRDTFEDIQKSRGKKQAVKYTRHSRHPLIGKMVCGNCRRSLRMERTKNPYFSCANRYVARDEGCVCRINVQFLEQYILFRLQEESEKRRDTQGASIDGKRRIAEAKKEKKQLGANLEDLQIEQVKLYEWYVLGGKSRAEYIEKKQELEEKRIHNKEMSKKLDEQTETLERMLFAEDADTQTNLRENRITELTRDVVTRFLKKIVIYDETHIEIEWNFSFHRKDCNTLKRENLAFPMK